MLCCKLPEVAVTLTVYVPEGVPSVLCEDPDPPPTQPTNNKIMDNTALDVASACSRRRLRKSTSPGTSSIALHSNGIAPGWRPGLDNVPVVIAAVVDTVACTGDTAPAFTLTELGTVHVGAGVTAGAIVQA